ncbi:TM1802 family CRISPR-associated protein [Chromatium okenii]|uniref:TM1802 family CRISPR-associated protein n=1 Tax=Chromatium okenii TaxID=61644 RepID=UPI0026F06B2A|nr:TM1802 family CRISPR-associated protein [Chromatium okenii]MBV5310965.1 CRISPR-associated protein [Chromatium okenii]
MFQRLYELSQCLPQRADWERLNEGMPANYDRGLALCFGTNGEWVGVKTYKGNEGVVYRSGPSNGTDFTPCCKLAGNTANRLANTVKVLSDVSKLSAAKRQWLVDSLATFNNAQADIWAEVEAKRKDAGIDDKTHRGYVYWADAAMNPVYSWTETRAAMVDSALEKFAEKGGKRAHGTCAVCGKTDVKVYGNYSVLACYNLNNPGSIAGGFSAKQAHRNFPVCGDCALAIAETFTLAETHFSSSMAGQTYLILPYSNSIEVRNELRARLQSHPDRYRLNKAQDLVSDELALTDEFADYGDQLAFALIFFKQQNAAWRVQAEVQQLLPSRLHVLHESARKISKAADLIAETKTELKPVNIGALTFKNFSSASDNASDDTLRSWLTALFSGQAIDRQHFIRCLVGKLLDTGKRNVDLLHWMTRHAWGLYRYALLTELVVLNSIQEHPAMSEVIPNSAYGRYIKEHADFFRRPELIVAFLTGCYASTVTSVQRKERGAEPFAKKFIGRLLTQSQLKRLYREGHSKLAQYGKLGYVITGLDPDLATAWVACGDLWAISDEEATFAFTIGYSLAYRIKKLDGEADADEIEDE